MKNIIKYILNNKNLQRFIVLGVLILLLLRQCNVTNNLKSDLQIVENVANRNLNNYKAARDTIRIERNKYNELVVSKGAYEYDINSLTVENTRILSKYKEALNIQKELKGEVSFLRAEINIKDSIINAIAGVVKINDTVTLLNFNDKKNWDKYNWRTFNGSIQLLRNDSTNNISIASSKFNISQGIGLKAAILKDNGISSLKISTSYPGVTFTEIENINLVNDKLNQKQTKKGGISIGFGFGYGINLNNNQIINTGPSIGIGVYYSPKFLRF